MRDSLPHSPLLFRVAPTLIVYSSLGAHLLIQYCSSSPHLLLIHLSHCYDTSDGLFTNSPPLLTAAQTLIVYSSLGAHLLIQYCLYFPHLVLICLFSHCFDTSDELFTNSPPLFRAAETLIVYSSLCAHLLIQYCSYFPHLLRSFSFHTALILLMDYSQTAH